MPSYPEDLDHPLPRGDASLLGIGWRELAGPLWRTPFRNVHVWSATDPDEPRQRACDAAGLLPDDGAIGGWAAATLGDAAELDGRGLSGLERQPVLLCLPRRLRIRRDPEVRAFRSNLADDDVTVVGGVRVTTPRRTGFDLARLGTLLDAVVALDYLGRGRPAFLDDVADYARRHRRLRGSAQVLRALALASPRSRSTGETRLRLLWHLEAGLRFPEVNAEVRHETGGLLGIADLFDPETGLIGEYDGAGHREAAQHAMDNAREEWLEDAGLVVVRATAQDLHRRAHTRTIARLLAAHRRANAMSEAQRRFAWMTGALPKPTPHW